MPAAGTDRSDDRANRQPNSAAGEPPADETPTGAQTDPPGVAADHDRRHDDAEDEDPPRRGQALQEVTGTGKLLRRKANRNHLLEKKPRRGRGACKGETEVTAGDAPRIKRLLGDR